MAREDYVKGDVKYLMGEHTPISEVDRVNPRRQATGTVFRKKYSNTSVLGVTEPTSIWRVPITDADVDKWAPFNRLTVHNLSDVIIDVRFNGSTVNIEPILPGTSMVWGSVDNQMFDRIDIYNESTVTEGAIGDIIVIPSRVN